MKRWVFVLSLVPVSLTIVLAQSKEQQLSAWRGKIEKKDGRVIVSNPIDPIYHQDAFLLEKELSIGEAQGAKEYLFARAWYIAVDDDGHIYVMDQGDTCVKVFDDHGKYLASIGRKGQGPGELQNPNSLHVISGHRLVFEDYIRGLNIFTTEGRFLSFLPTASLWFIDVLVTPDGRIVARVNVPGQSGKEIRVYDERLNLLKTLLFIPEKPYERGVSRPFAAGFHMTLAKDGLIVLADKDDYDIEVHNIGNSSSAVIRREWNRVEITKAEIDEMTMKLVGRKLEIPPSRPAIQKISADDEGRIFIKTYEKTKDGRAFYYDVFDGDGRYLAKAPIPANIDPQVWKKRKVYCLEEDAEGLQQVTRYRVRWQIPK